MTQGMSTDGLPRAGLARLLTQLETPGEIELPDGSVVRTGRRGPAVFRVIFRTQKALRTPIMELAVGRAFIQGDVDVEGNFGALFDARNTLQDKVPLCRKLHFLWEHVQSTEKANLKAISSRCSCDDSFYLAYMDKRFRFHSHGRFKSPCESIEEASEHKLEGIFSELGLRKGMRILDVGGGWGGVTQYCCPRGIRVTTLTLAPNSAGYIRKLIADNNWAGDVLLENYFNHRPEEPYDHIVSLGTVNHMPDYRKFGRKAWDLLKPGGRLYLDGAAAVEKHAVGSFTGDYIWPGTHTYMSVQDVIGELLNHGFALLRVEGETECYHLTMLEWAKRLDRARDAIIAGWGEETYRVFRLMMWGGQHAFKVNALQAYHLVAQKTNSRGPRPSSFRRFMRGLKGGFLSTKRHSSGRR